MTSVDSDGPMADLHKTLAAQDRVMRDDFSSFIARCFRTVNYGTEYLPNWHIDLIAEYLEAARRAEITRLIINMPPRALKSLCVTVAWPAFILGHDAAARIMTASYASSLSLKHSLETRVIMQSPWYKRVFADTRIIAGENQKHRFTTTKRGFRLATSVGGSATGEGGNFLIVDDPLHPIQAIGARTRSIANRWFDHTFSTRLNDKKRGVIVVVMQRLHPNDLTGHLLDKGNWEHLVIPALAAERTTIRFGTFHKEREAGEPLHEAREDKALIERARAELGSFAFEAQYQQNPLAQEGNIVRMHWFRRYDTVTEAPQRLVQSWDTGIKALSQHDASACVTLAQCEEGFFIRDVLVLREEYPALKKAIIAHAERWNADAVLIEDKASGQSLLQDLTRETQLPFIAYKPRADKITRLASVSALIEAGRVWLPKQAHWLGAFETELAAFPHAGHDDQVDAFSQGLHWLKNQKQQQAGIRSV